MICREKGFYVSLGKKVLKTASGQQLSKVCFRAIRFEKHLSVQSYAYYCPARP